MAVAVLAVVLMQNDVEMDVESEIITWPMGVTSKPPETKPQKGKGKTKGLRTSAHTVRGKNTVFHVLVNKVQAEQSEAVRQQQQKKQPTPGPVIYVQLAMMESLALLITMTQNLLEIIRVCQ